MEKSTEREMYKTTEESVEESEPAVDSGEMGGTNEEKDDSNGCMVDYLQRCFC